MRTYINAGFFMHGRLSDLIRSYTTPYSKRLTRSPSDAREYAALVDFQIKVALTLLAAYSPRTGAAIKMDDTPGVAQMLSGIKLAKRWSDFNDAVTLGWRDLSSIMRCRSGETLRVVVSMVAAPLKNEADCLARQLRRTGGATSRRDISGPPTARAV